MAKVYLIEKGQRNSAVKGPWLVCVFTLLLFSFSLFFKVCVLCYPLFIHFIMSESLQPYELQPTRLHCPWDFPNKNIGMGCHVFLQGIFLIEGSNLHLLHCRWILYHWVTREELKVYENSFIGKSLGNWLSHLWLGLVLYHSESPSSSILFHPVSQHLSLLIF